jgi:hypothetical protein
MPQNLMPKISFHNLRVWLIILFALCACTSQTPISPTSIPPTQLASPAPSIQPSPTPLTQMILFIPPTDDFLNLAEPVRSTLENLVPQEGWVLVESGSLTNEHLSEEVRVVVLFDPPPEIIDLAVSNPGVQFVALGAAGLEPQANISLIGQSGFRFDRQVFLAGYLAAILTDEPRIGEIVTAPPELRPIIEQSFRNGVTFYCGLCQLSYPPFKNYPIHTYVDPVTSEGDWMSSVDFLKSNAVETVFLFVQDFESEAIGKLLEDGVLLIGNNSPPEALHSNWIATIRMAPEQVLSKKWEHLLSYEGGWVEDIPIVLDDVNQTLFSDGRQRFFEKIFQDVQSGYIDPAVTPPAPIGN